MASDLFISKLSLDTTEDDLRTFLNSVVSPTEIVIKDGKIANTRIAFVTLSGQDSTEDVISALNGKSLKGSSISIKPYITNPKKTFYKKTCQGTPSANGAKSSVSNVNGDGSTRRSVVAITHIESGCGIYAQFDSDMDYIGEISLWLESPQCASARRLTPTEGEFGVIYGAPFVEDQGNYRVKLVEKSSDVVSVLFVDYGNTQKVKITEMFHLPPKLMNIPAMAHKCIIQGVELLDPYTAGDFLNKMLLYQKCEAIIYQEGASGICVDLIHEGCSLRQILLERDYARPIPGDLGGSPGGTSYHSYNLHMTDGNASSGGQRTFQNRHFASSGNASPSRTNASFRSTPRQKIDLSSPKAVPEKPSMSLKTATVCVTHVESCSEIYIQGLLPNSVNLLSRINALLPEAGKKPAVSPHEALPFNSLFVTQFSEDGELYRCRAVDSKETGRIAVRYVDFGNGETVPQGKLIPLAEGSELGKIPWLACRCVVSPSIMARVALDKQDDLKATLVETYEGGEEIKLSYSEECSGPGGVQIVNVHDFHLSNGETWREKLLAKGILAPEGRQNSAMMAIQHAQEQETTSGEGRKAVGRVQPSRQQTRNATCLKGSGTSSAQSSITLTGVVTYVTSLGDIWVQALKPGDNAQDLVAKWMSSMENEDGEQRQHVPPGAYLSVDRLYGAQSGEDAIWYRCRVVDDKGDQLEVEFVDFGSKEKLSRNCLVNLPEDLAKATWMAKKYSLRNVVQPAVADDKLSERLSSFLVDKEVVLENAGQTTNLANLTLKESNQSVVQLLLENGLVKQKTALLPTPKVTPQRNNSAATPTSGSSPRSTASPGYKRGKAASPREVKRPAGMDATLATYVFTSRVKIGHYRKILGFGMPEGKQLPEVVLELLSSCEEFSALKDEDKHIRDAFVQFIAVVKKMEEYSMESDAQFEEQHKDIQQRNQLCTELVSLVDKFDGDCDSLQEELLKFTLELQNKVNEVYECFKLIFPAGDPAKINCQVEDVDLNLLQDISTRSSLRKSIDTMDSAEELFKEVVHLFHRLLDPQSHVLLCEGNLADELVPRMRQFKVAMEHELAFYEHALSPAERSSLGHLLGGLHIMLFARLRELKALKEARGIFMTDIQVCRDILATAESPERALSAQEKVKSVRSRLRHKLADLGDAEEVGENDETVLRLKLEVCELRAELHSALLEENVECESLLHAAGICPELYLKYKKLNLIEKKSVIHVWDLWYFDMQMSVTDPCLFNSTFDGKPIVIKKEILTNETLPTLEGELKLYETIASKCPSLLSVLAVFRPPKEIHVIYFLQRSNTDVSFMHPKSRIGVLRTGLALLEGLSALYAAQPCLGHGSVETGRLCSTGEEEGDVALAPPEFPLPMDRTALLKKDCECLSRMLIEMLPSMEGPLDVEVTHTLNVIADCTKPEDFEDIRLAVEIRIAEAKKAEEEAEQEAEATTEKKDVEIEQQTEDDSGATSNVSINGQLKLALETGLPDSDFDTEVIGDSSSI